MKELKPLNRNPAEENCQNYLVAVNALAEQQYKSGNRNVEFLSSKNAVATHGNMIKMAVHFANKTSKKHTNAANALTAQLGKRSAGLNIVENAGREYLKAALSIAANAQKAGLGEEASLAAAFNSLAGNPGYDHFGNLGLMGAQMYEEQPLVSEMLERGDAFSVPIEPGGTGTDKTRFRAPIESVTGSAKQLMGDLNPIDHLQEDANRLQINLDNEFKNAQMIDIPFVIDQAQRDMYLGYESAVAPALGGFILQSRYFEAAIKHVMKLAEAWFGDGMGPAGAYVPGSGGDYGLLSGAIQYKPTSGNSAWDIAQPAPALTSEWRSNPTNLIQVIQNFYAVTTTTAAKPLDASLDPSLYYKDFVRLLNVIAQINVDWGAQVWNLFVPTTFYGIGSQYPGTMTVGGQGTFNKNLAEMIETATNKKLIPKINIVQSSMMNNRDTNLYGTNPLPYNYVFAVPAGCVQERKPMIMPGQTATPTVTSENVSQSVMKFRTQYLFGGPMIMHYGPVVALEFSKFTP